MNKRIVSLVLALVSASSLVFAGQTSDNREISGKLPKRQVLDLRSKKKHHHTTHKAPVKEASDDSIRGPLIASPIYLPSTPTSGTAITASNGFLYIVVGQKLYKVNEKSLKTVQVSQLGRLDAMASDSEAPKRHKKIVASNDDEPAPVRKRTKKHTVVSD